jgi:hypothetical protein
MLLCILWSLFVPNVIEGLLNGHLGSPQSNFQISNYHLPYRKLGFFSINIYICALNQGAHTSFSKMIFLKQIRMSSVLVHNWHETTVFTKYKDIILTWINSLKYNAWQLNFQNVQNVSVKSKLHLEIHYPHSSRWNKHNTLQLCDSRSVTQNHGDSHTSVSMSVQFVEFHGISFSY